MEECRRQHVQQKIPVLREERRGRLFHTAIWMLLLLKVALVKKPFEQEYAKVGESKYPVTEADIPGARFKPIPDIGIPLPRYKGAERFGCTRFWFYFQGKQAAFCPHKEQNEPE